MVASLNLTDLEEKFENEFFEFFARVDFIYVSSKIMNKEQIELLKSKGIKTAIDLKSHGETDFKDQEDLEAAGIQYINHEITSFDSLNFQTLCEFSKILEKAEGKVLVYCMSSNRVGALMALYLAFICGHPKKRAYDIGCKLGMTKEGLREKINSMFYSQEKIISGTCA